jgi:hypothetical protein
VGINEIIKNKKMQGSMSPAFFLWVVVQNRGGVLAMPLPSKRDYIVSFSSVLH